MPRNLLLTQQPEFLCDFQEGSAAAVLKLTTTCVSCPQQTHVPTVPLAASLKAGFRLRKREHESRLSLAYRCQPDSVNDTDP